jgi:hypothetical protein
MNMLLWEHEVLAPAKVRLKKKKTVSRKKKHTFSVTVWFDESLKRDQAGYAFMYVLKEATQSTRHPAIHPTEDGETFTLGWIEKIEKIEMSQ